MKKVVLSLFYYINILVILMYILVVLAALFKFGGFVECFFVDYSAQVIRLILAIPLFVFWIWSLIIWNKYDKSIKQFFLLFFLMALYTPFYYRRIIKNTWI